jgi:hypothetical protein
VQDSAKRQKVRVPSEDPITPIRAIPVRSEKGDFLQLPKVWSEPELCGPQSTLFLDDPELKIIQDLSPADRRSLPPLTTLRWRVKSRLMLWCGRGML